MTTYKITIKDNSIPEHMQKAIPNFHDELVDWLYTDKEINSLNEYTATITHAGDHYNFGEYIAQYVHAIAQELDTDPESLEILSIIKQ